MGYRTGAYCRIWSIERPTENIIKSRISISRKNKDGEYEQDFSGYVTFIANARAKAEHLHEGDVIRLKDIDVSTTYDREKKREYVNYKVFDFEFPNAANSNPAPSIQPSPSEGDVAEEEAPF